MPVSTYYAWLKEGEAIWSRVVDLPEGAPGVELSEREALLIELVESVKASKARCVRRMVLMIEKAAPDSWQAAAWKLERMYPQFYGRFDRMELTGREDAPLVTKTTNEMRLVTMTDEQRTQLRAILENRATEHGSGDDQDRGRAGQPESGNGKQAGGDDKPA